MLFGHILFMEGAEVTGFRAELRAEDYKVADLAVNKTAVMWYNTTVNRLRVFDGTEIKSVAWQGDGGSGSAGAILADGSVPMTSDLILSSEDQSGGTDDKVAVSRGFLNTLLQGKMNKLTGLGNASVVITDEDGNILQSEITPTELEALKSIKSNIQSQLDGKMSNQNLTLTSDLAAGGFKITNLGAPEEPTDSARMLDVQTAVSAIPLLAPVADIQIDASLQPSADIGVRYIITDPTQVSGDLQTTQDMEPNCVVERTSASEFRVMWAPSDYGAGYQTWVKSKDNFYEYNGVAWAARIIGAKPLSGVATKVQGDGKVDVLFNDKKGLALEDGDTNKLAILIDATQLEFGADGTIKLKADGVGIGVIDTAMFGTGFKLNDEATQFVLDDEALITAGFIKGTTFESITINNAPTEDTHGANKKYVDDAVKGIAGIKKYSKLFDVAATEFAYKHDAGQQYGIVQVFDEAGAMIVPSSIEMIDANNLKVVIPESKAVRIVFLA